LWTAASYAAFSVMNPAIRDGVAWLWFVISQLVFGVVAAVVFIMLEKRGAILAGLVGGAAGGLVMPNPAILWSLAAGHGIWYPVNLLAAMATHKGVPPTPDVLEYYHAGWFLAAL